MTFWHDHGDGDTREIAWVQVLRGLAAVVVIWAHVPVEIQFGLKWTDSVPLSLTVGAAADLFFVISGFVVVYASEHAFGRTDAPRVFFLRRMARILPLSWLTSGFILAVLMLTHTNLETAVHSAGSVAGSFGLFPALRPGGAPFPLNPPAWTMPYEILFYVAFAVAILTTRTRAVIAVTVLFVALSLAGKFIAMPFPFAGWCDPVILDFCFGMGIALAYRAGVRLSAPVRVGLVAAAMAAIAGSVMWGPFIAWRTLEWGVPMTFVVAAFVLREDATAAPAPWLRPLVFLGGASYSIYLTHYIVLPFPRRILGRFIEIPYAPWTLAFGLLAVAVIVGIVVHLAFERPVTRLLYRWIGEVRDERSAHVPLRAAEQERP